MQIDVFTLVPHAFAWMTEQRPLAAGTYALKWHAVAADQHRIEGDFNFTVR